MRRCLLLAAVLLAPAFAMHAGGDVAAQEVPDEALVVMGKGLYRQMCRQCHGHELKNSGASTYDLRTFPPQDKARFYSSVMEGSGDMPPHDDILIDEDIDALFAYVMATQQAQQQGAGN